MEVICAILVALFGIGFGIFMALQPEDAIALSSRRRYTQVPEPTDEYIRLTRLEGLVVSVLSAVLPENNVLDHNKKPPAFFLIVTG